MKILLWAMAFALAGSVCNAQTPPQRSISVSGEAHEDIAPDRAVMSVSLVSKNEKLAAAKEHNDRMVEKLVAVTREFKIPKEKVATSSVTIMPEYSYENGKQHFIGYTANRSLRITMDDLSIHERVLARVIDADIDQVNNVEFMLSNPEMYADKLRVKAFENAKAKAALLAQAAGAKLGAVMSISESGSYQPMPIRPMMAARMAGAESSVAPSLPGMITLGETVNVTFGLE